MTTPTQATLEKALKSDDKLQATAKQIANGKLIPTNYKSAVNEISFVSQNRTHGGHL